MITVPQRDRDKFGADKTGDMSFEQRQGTTHLAPRSNIEID